MKRLVQVNALPSYKLHVEYGDGVTGEVDLSHLVGKGVFAAWHDPVFFSRVQVGGHGQLRWSDDIELCGDAIYLEVTGQTTEALFSNLKAPADA